jgi:lipid A disaccharide synthetase
MEPVLNLDAQQKGRLFMAALLNIDGGEAILDEAIQRLCRYESFAKELHRQHQQEQSLAGSLRFWPADTMKTPA